MVKEDFETSLQNSVKADSAGQNHTDTASIQEVAQRNPYLKLTAPLLAKQLRTKRERKKMVKAEAMHLWEEWKDEESPNTFSFQKLTHDGGFSKVNDLYRHSRWVSASFVLVYVLYNVPSVAYLDIMFLCDPEAAAQMLGAHGVNDINKFYLCKSLAKSLPNLFGQYHALLTLRVIGGLELLGLGCYLFDFFFLCFRAIRFEDYKRWYAVHKIFAQSLPALSVYSAMRLLYFVNPAVLVPNVYELVALTMEVWQKGADRRAVIGKWVCYIGQIVFAIFVGFDTFLMKLRIVSVVAQQEAPSWWALIHIVQFFSQVVGLVSIGRFVMKRLFVFMFAGEDALLQDKEKARRNVWQALLFRRMYQEFPFHKFILVAASFSPNDFQRLVINEDSMP